METLSRRIEDLLAFHLVATEGGFTRAAGALGASKAAVSKQVSRLEAHLGSQLFHRSTRNVKLTDEGAQLLDYSRRIFGLSDEAGRKLRELNAGESGVIRISAPVSLGDVFFPSFIPEARKLLPKVTFDTNLSNEERDFRRDKIDFALRGGGVEGPELVARYLGKLRDAICCTPAVARRIGEIREPADLAGKECILSSLDPSWNVWTFTQRRKEAQVAVTGHLATNQYGTAYRFAMAGLGIARLTYYQAGPDLASGRLVQLLPEHQIGTHSLHLLYLKGTYSSKRHQVTRDAILAWFKRRPEIFI